MPKLLHKNILSNCMLIFMGIAAVYIFCFMIFSNELSIHGMYSQFNLIIFVLVTPAIEFKLFGGELPDYIFIAPYSTDDRKKFVKKIIIRKFWIAYGIFFLLLIVPAAIWSLSKGYVGNIIVIIIEAIIVAWLFYSGAYTKYLNKVSSEIWLVVLLRIVQYASFGGITEFNDIRSWGEIPQAIGIDTIVFVILTLAPAFGGAIRWRIKYYDLMVSNLADYEFSRKMTKSN